MVSPFLKVALATVIAPVCAEISWMSDMDEALKKAADEKKALFIEITASDKCGECQAFEKNVLATKEFGDAVEGKYVFVQLDFPVGNILTPEHREKNEKWGARLNVRGMPSIFLMDEAGLPYASVIGSFDDTNDFLMILKALERNRVIRDAAFSQARETSGKDQIKALVKALKSVPEESRREFYAKEMTLLEEIDKEDSTGFIKEQKYKNVLFQQEQEIYKEIGRFREEFHKGKSEKLLNRIQELLKEQKWVPESRQKLLLASVFFRGEAKEDVGTTVKELNSIIELAPRSQEAALARTIIRNLQEQGVINPSIPLHRTVPKVNVKKGK